MSAHEHDPMSDRIECVMCGGQVVWCRICNADLCCGVTQ